MNPYRKPTGRPRRCLWRSDYRPGAILDANALRRDMLAAGYRLDAPPPLTATCTSADGTMASVPLVVHVSQHPLYGWRWLLLCPCCGLRRGVLFGTVTGPKCRGCLGLRYEAKAPPLAWESERAGG